MQHLYKTRISNYDYAQLFFFFKSYNNANSLPNNFRTESETFSNFNYSQFS